MKIDFDYEVIFDEKEIQDRVVELAKEITDDYKDRELVVICNLKGAFMFCSDLCKHIDIPHVIDFIATSSYDGATESSGIVRIVKDLKVNIYKKDVLIVEDIIDTGLTLEFIINYMKMHQPRSVRTCTLLDKRIKRIKDVPIEYAGFEVDDRFVVGYGLDIGEKYRSLPYIIEYKGSKESL